MRTNAGLFTDMPVYPDHWGEAPLGVAAAINPESLGADTPAEYQFRYIDISSVVSGHIDWDVVSLQRFATSPSRARRIVRPGDVLLGTVRPYLQPHAFADWPDRDGYICSTGFAVLRAHEVVEPRFLYHLIFSEIVAKQLRRLETGSNYPAVAERDVRSVCIPIPPLPEQRRIAAVLDTADEAIRQTERLVEKLKAMKAGLLHDLLTRGLDEQGRPRDPEERPEEFKETVFGRIPVEWDIRALRQLAPAGGEYGSGAAAMEFDANLPRYVRITDITDDGRLDPNSRVSISQNDAEGYYLQEGDLLFARSGATVGKTHLYEPRDGECAHAGYVIKFHLDRDLCNPHFVSYWTQSGQYWSWVKRTLRQGAQPNINAQEYGASRLVYPSPEEQDRIALVLDAHDARIRAEESYLEKLRQVKAGLMEDLLTGRVRT